MRALLPTLLLAACEADPVSLDDGIDTGGEPATGSCAEGPCVPDPPGDAAFVGWMQVVVAEDGAAWVSWAEVDGPAVKGVWVARSPAPGAPLGPATAVPLAEPPFVGSTEKPSLAVQGDRLAVGYTGFGGLRHGDAHATYVQTGTIGADGAVAFDEALRIDDLSGTFEVTEMARVAFAPDGELWALWKRQEYGVSDWPTWARESMGFEPLQVSAQLSSRHDCSPPDFRFGPDGTARLAMRANVGGLLQTVVLSNDGQAFGAPVQVSDDEFPYDPDVCPNDGPRWAQDPAGGLLAAWLAPDDTGQVVRTLSAGSTDGGVTWSAPVVDHDLGEQLGERWLSAAATDDGRFLLAAEAFDGTTTLWSRGELGEAPSASPLLPPEGERFTDVELAAGPGRAVAVGLDEGRTLWLLELEP